MQAVRIVALLLVALLAGYAGVRTAAHLPGTTPPPTRGIERARPGDPAPAIQLPDREGRMHALADWQGRPLLVNFWASWCAPCIEEMPLLDAFAARQRDHGVQVLGIALDEPEAVDAFLVEVPVAYPILFDSPGPADSSVQLGNVRGVLPYSVLIDADGRVLREKLGVFSSQELRDWAAAVGPQ